MSDGAVDIPDLERITFFTGQRLTAADVTALQRTLRELRWLHNRSLHAWGIGIGLGVTGERGDSEVTIDPGYSVDCLGREVILTERRSLTVPAVAGGSGGGEAVFYLVAAYQGDADQRVTERRAGVCLPEGTVRLAEEPRLDWRRPDQLREGLELLLGQAWIQGCRLSRPLSLAVRRNARPSDQPYIAAGQTDSEATPWQAWTVGSTVVGLKVDVDTTAARFRSVPRYVAHVGGERFLAVPVPNVPGVGFLMLGLPGVVDPTVERFTLQVLLPKTADPLVNPPALLSGTAGPSLAKVLGWHVVWMGIEG
jgi:hypothetical protein